MRDDKAAELSSRVLQEAVDTVGLDDRQVQRSKDDARSYVTNTDKNLDVKIREMLSGESGYPVLSEESDTVPETDEYWVVDPIDGTISFAHGMPTYVTMAAFVRDSVPIASSMYLPDTDDILVSNGKTLWLNGDELQTNARPLNESSAFCSLRPDKAYSTPQFRALHEKLTNETLVFSTHCAGYGATSVAKGDAALAIYIDLNEWDYMPTIPVVEAAGGVVGSLETGEKGIEAVQDVNGRVICFAASRQLFDECRGLYNAV